MKTKSTTTGFPTIPLPVTYCPTAIPPSKFSILRSSEAVDEVAVVAFPEELFITSIETDSTTCKASPSDSLYTISTSVIWYPLNKSCALQGNGMCKSILLTLFSINSTIVDSKPWVWSPSSSVVFKKYPSCLGIKQTCVNGAIKEYSPSSNLNL